MWGCFFKSSLLVGANYEEISQMRFELALWALLYHQIYRQIDFEMHEKKVMRKIWD